MSAAVVQGVLDALAIIGPAVGHAVEGLVEIVRGQRPDLVTEPLPDLADVEAARAEAVERVGGRA